jgi:cysteine desulfurase
VEAMLPYFGQNYGNSSSTHQFGQLAEHALEDSRREVADFIGSNPHEIVFTSCGSESDNLALRGVAFAEREQRGASHILISPVEHHAVSLTALQLQDLHGFEVEFLPVDEYGIVDPDEVAQRIRAETAIVSVIHANNEIGSINPIGDIGEICRMRGVHFHTDSVQGAAHFQVNVDDLKVDLISIGAHKFYGTPIYPIMTGGGQEQNMRAGTHNIPYIVGLTKAFELAQNSHSDHHNRYIKLRNQVIDQVLDTIPESRLTGHPTMRLPNHASFIFKNVDGNTLLMLLDAAGYACSSGSACKTGDPEPSDVLTSLNLSREWALGSLRVTLGQMTTEEEIAGFLEKLPRIVSQTRELVPQ